MRKETCYLPGAGVKPQPSVEGAAEGWDWSSTNSTLEGREIAGHIISFSLYCSEIIVNLSGRYSGIFKEVL